MKTDIHPKVNPVVFIDSSSKVEFVTFSTLTSKETKKINGVEHYIIPVDVSSASHPFYTGEKMLVDTAGRVDKFRARQEAAEARKKEAAGRTERKAALKKESAEEKMTRKAQENADIKAAEKEAEAKKKEATKKKNAAKREAAKKTAKKAVPKKEDK